MGSADARTFALVQRPLGTGVKRDILNGRDHVLKNPID